MRVILASVLVSCFLLLSVLYIHSVNHKRRRAQAPQVYEYEKRKPIASYQNLRKRSAYDAYVNHDVSTVISYHEPIKNHPDFFHDLTITGPVFGYDGDEYYDVSFPKYWFDYSGIIVKHWQETLPDGISPIYDSRNPQIFLNGRKSNPYDESGVWSDGKDVNSLWTVALTNKAWSLEWIYGLSNFIGLHSGIGYVVIYKLKNELDDDSECQIKQMSIGDAVPNKLRNANYIIGRIQFFESDDIKYPDAWVFTKTAQKDDCGLEILRVYRIHFKDSGCMYRFDDAPKLCCYNLAEQSCSSKLMKNEQSQPNVRKVVVDEKEAQKQLLMRIFLICSLVFIFFNIFRI